MHAMPQDGGSQPPKNSLGGAASALAGKVIARRRPRRRRTRKSSARAARASGVPRCGRRMALRGSLSALCRSMHRVSSTAGFVTAPLAVATARDAGVCGPGPRT
eukprot:363970-Chlamydomonas_euryale.AAC.18